MMKPAYNVGVGVGVFVFGEDNKVLMHCRTGAHGADTWAPPGGKMDHGETLEQTATREVLEEAGIKIKDVQLVGFTNDIYAEGLHFITFWFISRLASGKARIMEPHKCKEMNWYDLSSLPNPLFLSTKHAFEDKTIVQKIKEYIEAL